MSCAPGVHQMEAITLRGFREAAKTTPPVTEGKRTVVPGTCKRCGSYVEFQLWPRDIEVGDLVVAMRATRLL